MVMTNFDQMSNEELFSAILQQVRNPDLTPDYNTLIDLLDSTDEFWAINRIEKRMQQGTIAYRVVISIDRSQRIIAYEHHCLYRAAMIAWLQWSREEH
jgi:hypothetical protein